MDYLIKEIRECLNLSQNEFAKYLNVSFATVNRWENGHSIPNKIAQDKIYELSKENNLPIYESIVNRITKKAEMISSPKGSTVLFHGSKSGIVGRILPISRFQCDFGKGFYMGTNLDQVLTLICDFEESKLYIVSLKEKDLDALKVPKSIDWALLVAYYRGRMNGIKESKLYAKYTKMISERDLVIGSIADDRMFYVIDEFFKGNMTDVALVSCLSALELGKQYVAITEKACDAIKVVEEIELSYLEKLFIREKAEQNRVRGLSLAKELAKKHRREGLYFDEILEQASR